MCVHSEGASGHFPRGEGAGSHRREVCLVDRMHVRKKWRPQEMSVIMCSCLMDFTFDLYVFHFLEWT